MQIPIPLSALLLLIIFLQVSLAAKATNVPCSNRYACFPYSSNGPFCNRGNRMNMRFSTTVTPERIGYDSPFETVTYAFCPIVDELEAFNLTSSLRLAATVADSTDPTLFQYSSVGQAFLTVYGLGSRDNILFPSDESEGKVMIVDNTTSDKCGEGELDVVTFLVLNITMEKGRFTYSQDMLQPTGVGFMPTCTADGACLLDATMHCIGFEGRQNCAECMKDPNELANKGILIWTSFYGTDKSKRVLRSGSNNPLNFRAFSGSGIYASISKSYNNVAMGQLASDDQLGPGG